MIMKQHQIPFKGHYTEEAAQARYQWLKEIAQDELSTFSHQNAQAINAEDLRGNIENFAGSVEIPIGIAGPLEINGKHAQGAFFAPIATTEGALVASICRGAKVLSLAGGVKSVCLHQKMMRAPKFQVNSLFEAVELQQWITNKQSFFNELISDVSSHAKLVSIEGYPLGRELFFRFNYESGDASGQNMTTACTWKICQWILQNAPKEINVEIHNFLIESNLSGDKKANFLNYTNGRGVHVVAEAFIPEEVLQQVLKVSATQLVKAVHDLKAGAIRTGMLGFNINVANVLGGIFSATGQDIASIHESALAQFDVCIEDGGVYCSMVLPALVIGTIGGGTGLPNQQDCLKVMGCDGKDKLFKFAEIIASYCLALDLSTVSAIANGQFAHAHEKLGRNRPDLGLKKSDLNHAFFSEIIKAIEPDASFTNFYEKEIDSTTSILTDLTGNSMKKCVGFSSYQLSYSHQGKEYLIPTVIKSKATSDEVINMLSKMAHACGAEVGKYFDQFKPELGFTQSEVRELAVYDLLQKKSFTHIPKVYAQFANYSKEVCWLALENLSNHKNLNTVNKINQWTEQDIEQVLDGMAKFHALYYDRVDELKQENYFVPKTSENALKVLPLIQALFDHHKEEFPLIYTPERLTVLENIIHNYQDTWEVLAQQTQTLIHNDFNPRNLALNRNEELCLYDWELATIHIPQHDLCEFLLFTLPNEDFINKQKHYVDKYVDNLITYTQKEIDVSKFWKGFEACHQDIALNRLNLYMMAHTFKDYQFMPRVLTNSFTFLQSIQCVVEEMNS